MADEVERVTAWDLLGIAPDHPGGRNTPSPDHAAATGRRVAVVADYHLPLLNLTADEVDAVVAAALGWAGEIGPDPHPLHMRSGLRKLTTSTEETQP